MLTRLLTLNEEATPPPTPTPPNLFIGDSVPCEPTEMLDDDEHESSPSCSLIRSSNFELCSRFWWQLLLLLLLLLLLSLRSAELSVVGLLLLLPPVLVLLLLLLFAAAEPFRLTEVVVAAVLVLLLVVDDNPSNCCMAKGDWWYCWRARLDVDVVVLFASAMLRLAIEESDVAGVDEEANASLLVAAAAKDNSSPTELGCNTEGGKSDIRASEDAVVGVVALGNIMLIVLRVRIITEGS